MHLKWKFSNYFKNHHQRLLYNLSDITDSSSVTHLNIYLIGTEPDRIGIPSIFSSETTYLQTRNAVGEGGL